MIDFCFEEYGGGFEGIGFGEGEGGYEFSAGVGG